MTSASWARRFWRFARDWGSAVEESPTSVLYSIPDPSSASIRASSEATWVRECLPRKRGTPATSICDSSAISASVGGRRSSWTSLILAFSLYLFRARERRQRGTQSWLRSWSRVAYQLLEIAYDSNLAFPPGRSDS